MDGINSFLQNNFYAINALIGVGFIVIYGLLLSHLIGHMREMVRLKYHVSKRAEFDESRVKIIIGILIFLVLLYFAVWIFCLTSLTITNEYDYEIANALFKAASVSLLIGAYFIYFLNNRIKADIRVVQLLAKSKPDKYQKAFNHL